MVKSDLGFTLCAILFADVLIAYHQNASYFGQGGLGYIWSNT